MLIILFFRNLSMTACIMNFKYQNYLLLNVSLTNLGQVAKLNSVYIFIL